MIPRILDFDEEITFALLALSGTGYRDYFCGSLLPVIYSVIVPVYKSKTNS
jgi:uncharacterized integral membrane protein